MLCFPAPHLSCVCAAHFACLLERHLMWCKYWGNAFDPAGVENVKHWEMIVQNTPRCVPCIVQSAHSAPPHCQFHIPMLRKGKGSPHLHSALLFMLFLRCGANPPLHGAWARCLHPPPPHFFHLSSTTVDGVATAGCMRFSLRHHRWQRGKESCTCTRQGQASNKQMSMFPFLQQILAGVFLHGHPSWHTRSQGTIIPRMVPASRITLAPGSLDRSCVWFCTR